jgi:hypothetical protein
MIHELTHVWQGHHSGFASSFVFAAGIHHVGCWLKRQGDSCVYDYVPGKAWKEYSVEQQAELVQDWFAGGAQESHPLFPYIRDQIRKP